jgi:hypothetical protein
VRSSRLLLEVMAPLITIKPVAGEELPAIWSQGEALRFRLYLFGIVPMGIRTILFERVDADAREIQTHETDPLVRRWDHLIHIRPAGIGRCQYRDEIVIEAGWLTGAVWLFAHWFYRRRQRRWQIVARRLACPGS